MSPTVEAQIPNHWTTREISIPILKMGKMKGGGLVSCLRVQSK